MGDNQQKNVQKNINQQPKKKQNNQNQPKKKQPNQPRKPRVQRNPGRQRRVYKKKGVKTNPAPGVLLTLPVSVSFDPTSFTAIPLGWISRGMTRGGLLPYNVFFVAYSDNASIASGGNGVAPCRQAYNNSILNSLSPKSVPLRSNYKIAYDIVNINPVPPSPNIPVDGGLTYFLYNPSNSTSGIWQLQTAPSIPASIDAARAAYIEFLEKLGSVEPHTRILRNIELTTEYLNDTSAMARISPYYGYGIGVGGPFASSENEVPFKNRYLGTLIPFSNQTPRASRFLTTSSGDSACNWGLGSMDSFPLAYYQSAVTSVFKFIDLDEVLECLIIFLKKLIESRLTSNPPNNPTDLALITDMFVPQGVSITIFFLSVIQQFKWMFSDSQNLAQFMSPQSPGAGSFQAFLCGSNCCPKDPASKMIVPIVLNENMKMLQMCMRPYVTNNFNSNKNVFPHIPVLGTWKTWTPRQYFVNYNGINYPMFASEVVPSPNIFDGTMGGQCVDLNETTTIQVATNRWNELVGDVKSNSSTLCELGGECPGSPLLQYTRYVQFGPSLPVGNLKYTRYTESQIIEKPLVRTNSQGRDFVSGSERIYAPPAFSMGSQITIAYSSMLNITPTFKANISSLIIPVLELIDNTLPSQTQYQSAVMEPVSMDGNGELPARSRGTEIDGPVINNYIRGLAGVESDLAKFIIELNKRNEGGVLGDLFMTVGGIAEMVGVPVVGPVARMAGTVANTLGIF